MEQIFLSDDRDVSYNVSCATSMAACETHPGLLCDVLPSAAPASSPEALSFEDAFDGDARRRLTHVHIQHKDEDECDELGCNDHCPACQDKPSANWLDSACDRWAPYTVSRKVVDPGWYPGKWDPTLPAEGGVWVAQGACHWT